MPETFIVKDDYVASIRTERLDQILDQDDTILELAESTAVAEIKHALSANYDTDAIFANTSDARDKSVLKWCVDLSLGYLYERIPDDMTPEHIERNFDNTIKLLDDIAKGKRQADLPRKLDENSEELTRRRWGSYPARSH